MKKDSIDKETKKKKFFPFNLPPLPSAMQLLIMIIVTLFGSHTI